jgi:hypothetical protein
MLIKRFRNVSKKQRGELIYSPHLFSSLTLNSVNSILYFRGRAGEEDNKFDYDLFKLLFLKFFFIFLECVIINEALKARIYFMKVSAKYKN